MRKKQRWRLLEERFVGCFPPSKKEAGKLYKNRESARVEGRIIAVEESRTAFLTGLDEHSESTCCSATSIPKRLSNMESGSTQRFHGLLL